MFQTMYNPFEPIQVIKSKESLTVPDMSFTPREIIAKFSRGEKVPLGFKGLYDSADDVLDGYDSAIFEDDPTRDPSFDFGDYVEEKHSLEERERQRKNAQKRKSASESKRKASAEESSASEAMTRETTSEEAEHSPSVQRKSNE